VLPQPCGPGITELRARLAKALTALGQSQAAMVKEASAQPAPKTPTPASTSQAQQAPRPPLYSEAALQVSEATVTEFNRVVEASERKFS
jgi:trans-aconitate methyltransferase